MQEPSAGWQILLGTWGEAPAGPGTESQRVSGRARVGFGLKAQGHQLTLTTCYQTPSSQTKHHATRQVGAIPSHSRVSAHFSTVANAIAKHSIRPSRIVPS